MNDLVSGGTGGGSTGIVLGGRRRPGCTAGPPGSAVALGPQANAGPGLLSFPRSMSNALLVSAATAPSGHPSTVMGPQVAYFTPEILMEEDIHGPGVDAEGAAFPGVNLYVELGHGRDYAWSATSVWPEHHRHVRGAAVQPGRRQAIDQLQLLPARAASACRWRR